MTQTIRNNVKCILTLVAFLLVGVVGVKAEGTGDVTGDGNVDMADALAIVEIILGQAVEGDEHDYNFKAANVDEDEEGKITIADVVALLSKYILSVSSEETTSGPSSTFMIDPGI